MAQNGYRPPASHAGSRQAEYQSILFYYIPETGKFKARFSHHLTLKDAKADAVEVECHGRPFCCMRLTHRPHLVDLLQKTGHAISQELTDLEGAFADIFFTGKEWGVRETHKDFLVVVEDDKDGRDK